MREKYFISIGTGEGVVGLRYDLRRRALLIGGNKSLASDMRVIMEDCFGVEKMLETEVMGANKIRMAARVGPKRFTDGMERVRAIPLPVERVRALGRIMR